MSAGPPLLPRRLRPVIQVAGFVRKEIIDVLRQPRLLLVLVAGPFLIMLLFALGYDQESVRLRTVFVAPEGSVYETAIERYGDELDVYIEQAGVTSDVIEGRQLLESGDADLVVVFPPEPVDTVLGGDPAVITVLHDKLDPLQQTAVEVSAQVAVLELNATVLEQLVGQGQGTIAPFAESVTRSEELLGVLDAAVAQGDSDEIAAAADQLRSTYASLGFVVEVSDRVLAELGRTGDAAQRGQTEAVRADLAELEGRFDDIEDAVTDDGLRRAVDDLREGAEALAPRFDELVTIDPRLAVRPFAGQPESLLRTLVSINEFFTPSALSLLLQHLAITFAAVALVRDAELGLFESFRVAPVAARHILVGKYLAYLVIGGVLAAVLIAAVVVALDIPIRGALWALMLAVALLLAASVGLGFVLSALARTPTQAIQYAMLTLLAGLFFGGFLVTLDAFRFPIRLVSWTLPVTYAIRWLQDVMLRGTSPDPADVIGLVALTAIYGAMAWFLLAREMRVR